MNGHGDRHLPDTLRTYRYTAIYVCCAALLVLALLAADVRIGPIPTMCP